MRRLTLWWVMPPAAVVVAMAWFQWAGGVSLIQRTHRLGWLVFVLVISLAPALVTGAVVVMKTRRIKRAYAASDGCLCTGCTHDLRGLGEQGTCPECGRAFDVERDRLGWQQAGIARAR